MLTLSWHTFRERWQLFLGAMLTVCLGVALVQSSLLILISLATMEAPPGATLVEQLELSNRVEAPIALQAVTTGFAVFLTAFIVSSTFAFTVAQRHRDIALLRLVGGERRQVRRLLLSEALLLGIIGTVAGVPVGLLVAEIQTGLLNILGFLPPGFAVEWRSWILGVSFGVGTLVSVIGVLVAARRVRQVRPVEALRDTGAAGTVMNASRWFLGVFFLLGGIAMVILSTLTPSDGAEALAVNSAMATSVGLALLSPSVVPFVGWLFGRLVSRGVPGELAAANVRDGVRRTASTAAPVLVLVGLLLGQVLVGNSMAAAAARDQRAQVRADFVLEHNGRPDLGSVPGVAVADTTTDVPVVTTSVVDEGDGEFSKSSRMDTATVIDPAAYRQTHPRPLQGGSWDAVTGSAVAVSAERASDDGLRLGGQLATELDGRQLSLRVAAILPDSIGGTPGILLPRDLVGDRLLADTPSQTMLTLQPGADRASTAAALGAYGTVQTADRWLNAAAEASNTDRTGVTIGLMGVCSIYALIAVINAVVIAGTERKREFAMAQVSGLTRGQVVLMALLESWMVAVTGLLLGGVCAGLSAIGALGATAHLTGSALLSVPWVLTAVVIIGVFIVVGFASVLTSMSATRSAPVRLVSARE